MVGNNGFMERNNYCKRMIRDMKDIDMDSKASDPLPSQPRRINLDVANTMNSFWLNDMSQPWTPFNPTVTGIQLTMPDTFNTMIRKVENGFILKLNGKEFVFESVDNLLNKLKEELTTK